jgi:5-methylcytosine-specific restriction endonuclease McrA
MSQGIYKRIKATWIKGKTKKDYPQLSNLGVKKGNIPWNKNKKLGKNPEHSKKMKGRIAHNKGIKSSYCGEKHHWFGKNHSKENNAMWLGGITLLSFQIRNLLKYRQWRSDVFTRDNFICQGCGKSHCYFEAHHIKMFSLIMKENNIKSIEEALLCEELWNINNGVTLCEDCHKIENRKQQLGNKYAIKNTNAIANVKSLNTNT